jgi:hypothetical protein
MNHLACPAGVAARVSAIAATTLLAVACDCNAETNPWFLYIAETVAADSNVRRAPDASALVASDIVATTTLAGGYQHLFGRQDINANVRTQFSRYASNPALNSTEYNAALQAAWQTVARLSGTANVETSRTLFRLDQSTIALTSQAFTDNRQAKVQAKLGSDTPVNFEGGIGFDENQYSVIELQGSNRRQVSSNIGIRYTPRIHFTTALSLRHTSGTFGKSGVSALNDFIRDDLDLSTGWVPTSSRSQLSANLSYTRIKYALQSQRSSNGLTGAFTYKYEYSGKTTFTANFRRDNSAGSQTSAFSAQLNSTPVTVTNASSDNLRTDLQSLAVQYQLTGKIFLNGIIEFQQRQLDNASLQSLPEIGVVIPPSNRNAHDNSTSLNLSATYSATRSLRFNCGAVYYQRTLAGDAAGLSYPLHYNSLSCSAGFTLN